MAGLVAPPREDRLLAGVVLMVVAVFCFTLIDTSAKWLVLAGIPSLQVVFARYAGHFIASLLIFVPREGLSAFRSRRPGIQFLRSATLLMSTTLNFFALKYLPISVTITIFFAAPMLVSLMGIPILGEKVGLRRFLAIIAGFIGVVIVVQPWGVAFDPAMFLSLGAVTGASLYYVLTRLLAGIETNAVSQLWSSGLPTICVLPFALTNWHWPETIVDYVVIICIGLWAIAGHIALNIANRYADASLLVPVIYVQLIFATLAGYLVFSTLPTIWTIIGAAVIIGSGIYIWRREKIARSAAKQAVSPAR